MASFGLTESLQLFVALPLATALAALVWRTGTRGPGARALVALLLLEGLAQAVWGAVRLTSEPTSVALGAVGVALFGWLGVTYMLVLRSLDTALTRPLRTPAGMGAVVALFGLPATMNFAFALANGALPDVREVQFGRPGTLGFDAALVTSGLVGLFGLAAALLAMRRAAPGTTARRRARAFAVAFAARDLVFAAAIGLGETLVRLAPERADLTLPIWPLATIFFVPLIAYGILSTQLFDVDLRIKTGISRGTVVTIGLIVVLAAAKVAEQYLSRTLGFVAGGIAAGALLVLAPRLNRFGDRVANAALPSVQPTPGYVLFKKLEVYPAAIEAALETGGLSEKERASLARLRDKLGLAPDDASALELEVTQAATPTPTPVEPA